MKIYAINGLSVWELPEDGPLLATERDATDLIGETFGHEIDVVVVPVTRLQPDFFKLSTTLAGNFIQKFTNYHCRLAILGDISAYLAGSKALRDFVRESNKRTEVVFASDRAELEALVR